MSAVETEKKPEEEKKTVKEGGELLFCGATNWDSVGRKGTPAESNLVSPTRLRPLVGLDIRFVASGCTSCHCVALDVEGRCYTWGRNEKGQLGHGDYLQRDRPTIVSDLLKHKIIRAGAGWGHTVVVTEDGNSFSFGWNKHGQLGSGSIKTGSEETESKNPAVKRMGIRNAAKASANSKKRKTSLESDPEDEEEHGDDDGSEEEDANGQQEEKGGRGGTSSGRGRGRGRGAKKLQMEEKKKAQGVGGEGLLLRRRKILIMAGGGEKQEREGGPASDRFSMYPNQNFVPYEENYILFHGY